MLCQSQPSPTADFPAFAAPGEPFESAEQAWLWTMSVLLARREGTGSAGRGVKRPCDPDDVVKCLDLLYRRRRIDLEHARILRIWGERQTAPSAGGGHTRLWREAMARLDWPLRMKGIVA